MTGSIKVVSAISRLGTHSKPSSARPGAVITLAVERTETHTVTVGRVTQ